MYLASTLKMVIKISSSGAHKEWMRCTLSAVQKNTAVQADPLLKKTLRKEVKSEDASIIN